MNKEKKKKKRNKKIQAYLFVSLLFTADPYLNAIELDLHKDQVWKVSIFDTW
jgi:hypothetical protein